MKNNITRISRHSTIISLIILILSITSLTCTPPQDNLDREVDDFLKELGLDELPTRVVKETLEDRYEAVFELIETKKRVLWESTSPDNIRGTHYLLPNRAYNNNFRQTSFEFFINTTGLRSRENRKFFGNVFDIEVFDKAVDIANPLGNIGEVLRETSIEQHRLGVFTRFAARFKDFIFKFEAPLVLSLNHLWMSLAHQKTLKEFLSEGSSQPLLTDKQVNTLVNLVLDPNFNARVGDLRFSAQWIPFTSPDIEPYIGLEVFLPIIRPSYFNAPRTRLTYPQDTVTIEDLLSNVELQTHPDGSDVDQYTLANPTDLYKFLFDTLTILRTTQFSPDGDNLKFGFGFLLGANTHLSNEFDFFIRSRFNRLLGGTRYRIIPVETQLVPSEFKVKISPVTVFQGTLGVAKSFKKWNLSVGYDLYLKTEERINSIEATEEALEKLKVSRAEIPSTSQHKLLAELSRESTWGTLSLGGDYTLFSKGTDKEWSLVFSATTYF
ncbi:hypothetical protein KAU11_05015 [Candidatus Babeliales bacterium]|nr:hypothetical protein [Candidatus Babeliales bacterium]